MTPRSAGADLVFILDGLRPDAINAGHAEPPRVAPPGVNSRRATPCFRR